MIHTNLCITSSPVDTSVTKMQAPGVLINTSGNVDEAVSNSGDAGVNDGAAARATDGPGGAASASDGGAATAAVGMDHSSEDPGGIASGRSATSAARRRAPLDSGEACNTCGRVLMRVGDAGSTARSGVILFTSQSMSGMHTDTKPYHCWRTSAGSNTHSLP